MDKVYINIGSSWSAPVEWLNYDCAPSMLFERIPLIGWLLHKEGRKYPKNVLYGDIIKGLPHADNTIDGILASHVLEHMSLDDCHAALDNAFKLLKPGGILRVIVPDLKVRCEMYLNELEEKSPEASHNFMALTHLGSGQRPKGIIGILRLWIGLSHHLWMWDEHSMSRALEDHGFKQIRACKYGDCQDPIFKLAEQEGRFIHDGIIEVALEAIKPE